ncbi:Uncharacterised protein [Mycobacteroides abscessus subsp. abscessus]|uniref:hypothetical protein n=1 Tax=Mycobacteroides abscessus TaxID=36809 RepID=UPI0009CF0080|nr:hypothetical protein [Mycobacteroides abscessus]SLJ39412.1 Uncharacterised protein [Mycobacteroides abscessus subsp. abscessus]
MPPRRSPWLNDRATLLVQYLADSYGLTVSEDVAREDVSSHLDLIAERMRIGRQAAKYYVTDDAIRGLADHIAKCVDEALQQEAPEEHQRPPLRLVDTPSEGNTTMAEDIRRVPRDLINSALQKSHLAINDLDPALLSPELKIQWAQARALVAMGLLIQDLTGAVDQQTDTVRDEMGALRREFTTLRADLPKLLDRK